MRAPRTITIFWLAVGLAILGAVSIPNYYPAPVTVLGPDGAPLLGANGKAVVHREMGSYYRYVLPGLLCFAGSICLLGWCLLRKLRSLFDHEPTSPKAS